MSKNKHLQAECVYNLCNIPSNSDGKTLAGGSGSPAVNSSKQKQNGHIPVDSGCALFRADLSGFSGKTLASRVFTIARLAHKYEQADPWMGLVWALEEVYGG